MNSPTKFLHFRKRIDELRDEAIENKDAEMLSGIEFVEGLAKKQGKNYYQLVHEILVRDWHG